MKLLGLELAKVSPFVLLLFVCLKVVWKHFLEKDTAMTQQMIQSNEKLVDVSMQMVEAQKQTALSYQQMSGSLDKNSEAIGLLTETIDDNHTEMIRKLNGMDAVKVKPLNQRRPAVEPKAQA